MKRTPGRALVLCIAVSSWFLLAGPGERARADDASEIAALRQRVQELEARVRELEIQSGRPTTRPVSQLGPILKGDLLHVSLADLAGPGVLTVRDVRVGEDGTAGLPMIGGVKLVGLTLPDAERAIERNLRDRNLIQNAQLKVERWEAAGASNAPTGPLRTGDLVRVVVTDLRGPGVESVINTQVDEQGNVDLPIIHLVKVVGLSEVAAAAAIDRAFRDANLLQNAGATVLRTGAAEGL